MALINRAMAQNLAALTVGVLLAAAVATAQIYAERSTRTADVKTRAHAVANMLRADATAVIGAIERIDLGADALDAAAAETLLAATPPGEATLDILGVAVWRREGATLSPGARVRGRASQHRLSRRDRNSSHRARRRFRRCGRRAAASRTGVDDRRTVARARRQRAPRRASKGRSRSRIPRPSMKRRSG